MSARSELLGNLTQVNEMTIGEIQRGLEGDTSAISGAGSTSKRVRVAQPVIDRSATSIGSGSAAMTSSASLEAQSSGVAETLPRFRPARGEGVTRAATESDVSCTHGTRHTVKKRPSAGGKALLGSCWTDVFGIGHMHARDRRHGERFQTFQGTGSSAAGHGSAPARNSPDTGQHTAPRARDSSAAGQRGCNHTDADAAEPVVFAEEKH